MEVQVIIDGKKLTADSNETILQVARRNGIEIPTLCYLKDVNEPASCRVCVVEVEGMRNLCTACSTKVRQDMVVKTNTVKVINVKNIVKTDIFESCNHFSFSKSSNFSAKFFSD